MTREEILAMKPGRELDALIAEKVMGIKVVSDGMEPYAPFENNFDGCKEVQFYSTSISVAWEVVGKTKVAIIPQSGAPKEMSYCVIYEAGPFNKEIKIFAETAPEAICKAALLAVMGEE